MTEQLKLQLILSLLGAVKGKILPKKQEPATDLSALLALLSGQEDSFWKVGSKYKIETSSKIVTGILTSISETDLVVDDTFINKLVIHTAKEIE